MRTILSKIILVSALFTMSNNGLFAQNICMVTADFQNGENYMVIWEKFTDVSNIDSIYIYRREGLETAFTKIGAVDVTLTSPTYFVDTDANTMDTTKYAISILNNSGTESLLSPWHQAVVMDYVENNDGQLIWTKYRKEDQVDESYIYSYECFMDPNGLGNFTSMAIMMNYDVMWFDQAYLSNPNSKYYLEVALPNCDMLSKANINTSRSNIKNQKSNENVMLEEEQAGINSIKGVKYTLSPNPVVNELTITSEELIKGTIWIADVNGKKLIENVMEGNSTSFDTSLFNAGVYFINIESNGVVTSRKFIKR